MEHSVSLSAPSGAGECSRPPDLLIIKSSTVSHLRAQFERRQAEAKLAATSNNGKLVESDPSELSLTREDETSGVETATGESPSQQRQETEKSQSAKQLSVRRKSLSDASCGPVSRSCDRSTIAGSLVKKMEGRSKSLNDATVVPIKAAFGRSATVGALVKKLEGHSKSSSDDNLTSAKPTCQINAVGSLVEMLARQSRGQPRANGAQKSASSTGRSPECSPTLVSVGQDEEMQVSPIAALKAKFERQSSCTLHWVAGFGRGHVQAEDQTS
ncbi:hypothetical protein CSUI_008911 [Cystoisospora suis]|uniref:Uncharacterized protein n=1 Tax=Cystoisospora suis TaxID=483139 RepID=A0A2C6KLG3_9APIC|nr:hypothetical protein CSUI_008911 [Cystoisospora suis]